MTTLTVTIGDREELRRDTIARIRAAEAGEPLPDDEPVLHFESYERLTSFLTRAKLDLLEAIVRERPASIRETARIVDRDYREVHRNLSTLESLGLLRYDGGGPGKPKRPVVPYDDIEVSIPLTGQSADSTTVDR